MPEGRLQELFEQVARMDVDVPPADRIVARARQRRRRTRLQVSAIAWTVLVAAGFGAPQAAVDLAGSPQHMSRTPPAIAEPGIVSRNSPLAAHRSLATSTPDHTAGTAASPAASASTPASPAASVSTVASPAASVSTAASPAPSASPPASPPPSASPPASAAPTMTHMLRPPFGLASPSDGQLLLGLDASDRFVITTMGSASAPVPLPGLKPPADAPPVLVTNPAGGWVVTYSVHLPASKQIRPAQLALVTAAGRSEPFGPVFIHVTITSAAVSPDGSRVAIALTGQAGRARIAVLPLPGHHSADRSWSLPFAQANLVTSLSWAPDGRHLSYIAGQQSGAGVAGSPVTLDTAARSSSAPVASGWPSATKSGAGCVPDVTAWLGTSGRFAALEECKRSRTEVLQPTDASTGAATGQPLVVARHLGCRQAALDPAARASRILISYCGLYLDDHGTLTQVPGDLTAAALSG